ITENSFIENPFGAGKLYRTGDLGRWQADGNIEYLGRIDDQVKINGLRIELGEIESCIRKIDKIIDVAVIVKETNNDKQINAYYVSKQTVSIEQIKNELSKALPEYMVPNFIMELEEIPLNRNGKLDKNALPNIDFKSVAEYVAPATEIEITIAKAFEEILNIEKIGIEDNFFELGGDSIKAIRIVSKLRENNLNVSVKNIMVLKTIRKIASDTKLNSSTRVYNQDELVGNVNLTPIQTRFFEQKLKNPNHYNQSIGLSIKKSDFDLTKMQQALDLIIKNHDILRSMFENNLQTIQAFNEAKHYDMNIFENVEYTSHDDLKTKIELENTNTHATMDIENGKLIKVNIFFVDEEVHMFIMIHHLVIDGVSWRILADDLENYYSKLIQTATVDVKMKTASYLDWYNDLEEYSTSKKLIEELPYWENSIKKITDSKILKIEKIATSEKYNDIQFEINEELTKKLVFDSNKMYSTQINDLLLAGLTIAVKEWSGNDTIAIDLEGHGREDIGTNINVGRTIGWFTSVYPIALNYRGNIEDTVIDVKENIRRVPNKGIGFNVLKYMSKKLPEFNNPEISFNYLGDISSELATKGLFQQSEFPTGVSISYKNSHGYPININSIIDKNKFNAKITYDASLIKIDEIEKFAKLYEEALIKVIETCVTTDEVISTPSDLNANFLSFEDYKQIVNSENLKNIEAITKLSTLQEGMVFHNIAGETSEYSLQNTLNIAGNLKVDILRQSLALVISKHQVLRSNIKFKKYNEPFQIIYKETDIEFAYYDENSTIDIQTLQTQDNERGFDLENDSLIRATVLKESDLQAKLILTCHHIIVDGWSTSVLFNDLMNFYDRLTKNESTIQIEAEISKNYDYSYKYTDYKLWMLDKGIKEGLEYYKDYLNECESTAALDPISNKSENIRGKVSLEINEQTTAKLEKLAKKLDVTISTILETAWGLLLQKYNNSQDILFGKVVSGRDIDIDGIIEIVGLFINTIPVRMQINEKLTIRDLLVENQINAVNATEYQHISLSDINEVTNNKASNFETLFIYENFYSQEMKFNSDEIKVSVEDVKENTGYPITLVIRGEDKISIDIEHNNFYTQKEMSNVLSSLNIIIEEMIENVDNTVEALPVISHEEKTLITENFNNTEKDFNNVKTLVEIFEEQVEKTPNNIAAEFEDEQLTYKELNARANKLARKLREAGANVDEPIALIVNRSLEMIVSIYAVMKAGSCYLPIDPNAPIERINYILEDSEAKIVLVETENMQLNAEIMQIDVTAEANYIGTAKNVKRVNVVTDLAYIIYTSGTTGNPKGVEIEHRSVINRIRAVLDVFPLNSNSVVIQKANYSFDYSVSEVLTPMFIGAKIALPGLDGEKDIKEICKTIYKHKVTQIHFIPTLLNVFLSHIEESKEDREMLTSLERVLVGGESVSIESVNKFNELFPSLELGNQYGPTEASIDVTCFDCKQPELVKIPIGKPISNIKMYIVDGVNLCAIGMIGEIC
ncbi:MAG: condensation domain-containing protein, partial [Mycoplasmatales bacterium]